MSNLYEKLSKIQVELKAPKSQYNSFGKYSYRNLEDILEALKPLLEKYKAALTLSDDVVEIGGRFYIKAAAKFIDIENGVSEEVYAYAREDLARKGMDLSQLTGSTSSYARKYALNGLFAIDDNKDSDFSNKGGSQGNLQPSTPRPPFQPTTKQSYKGAAAPKGQASTSACQGCGVPVTDKVASYSTEYYGKSLCRNCQGSNKKIK